MTDTLRKLGRERFCSLVNRAVRAENEDRGEESSRYLAEADRLAQYVLEAYGIADFAFVTGAA
jgi:hypothetical protein